MRVRWVIAGLLLLCFCSLISVAQKRDVKTDVLHLTFNEDFRGNKYWAFPLNILDSDLTTFSSPFKEFSADEEGMYYLLRLKRPLDSSGQLIEQLSSKSVLKVQLKIVYGLFYGVKLARFSHLDFEGFVRRLENVEVSGSGLSNMIVEIVDVTKAKRFWDIKNPRDWDEMLIRFAARDNNLGMDTFRVYEIQLLVTYIAKEGGSS